MQLLGMQWECGTWRGNVFQNMYWYAKISQAMVLQLATSATQQLPCPGQHSIEEWRHNHLPAPVLVPLGTARSPCGGVAAAKLKLLPLPSVCEGLDWSVGAHSAVPPHACIDHSGTGEQSCHHVRKSTKAAACVIFGLHFWSTCVTD